MPHVRYRAAAPIAEPAASFRDLAPQLMTYPNVPTRTVETILDALAAAGSEPQIGAICPWSSPGIAPQVS